MNILVTGGKGQLGTEILQIAEKSQQYNYLFVDMDEMDLSSEKSIRSFFTNKDFNVIVNCAAYTAVDKAEDEEIASFAINSTAVKILVNICLEKQIRLIHISTDYVFDGAGNHPLSETSPTGPLSVYGKSKLEGENHILSNLPDAYILRTSWLYSAKGKNFVRTIAGLSQQRNSLNVVCDQIGSPTYAEDLAMVIVTIIDNIKNQVKDVPALYHYSNEGVTSWYDFASFIVDYIKSPCKIVPVRSSEYSTRATRPLFTLLDKTRIKTALGIEIPHWHTSLKKCLANIEL